MPLSTTAYIQATIDVIEKQLPAVLKLKEEGELGFRTFGFLLKNFPFPGEMNVENIDVFCEKGVFEVEHSQRILEVRGHPYIDVMADRGEGGLPKWRKK